jgi:PPP family 3-phenylpropionic acid transporter
VGVRGPTAQIVLYVALYAAFGVASPFWPKFFETRGLAPQQIGVILAAAMSIRLISGPLLGTLADSLGSLRLVLASCACVSASAALALISAETFWPLFFVALLQAAALAPTTSIADALAVNVARPKIGYGWLRGSASAAFVVGTLSAGQLISGADLSAVIWMNAAFLIAAAGSATILPPRAAARSPSQRWLSFPMERVKALLRMSRFRIVILVSALVYGSHAVHDAFAVILWSDAGISNSAISLLWSEAVVAEVFVFFFLGPALLDRFGPRGAAALAAAAGAIRWSVAGVTTSVLLLSLVQPFHGLTFALIHLASMRVMATVVEARVAATAQSLYAFSSGSVTAALTFFSGMLYASQGRAAFFLMAALCVIALPIAWFGFGDEGGSSGGSV